MYIVPLCAFIACYGVTFTLPFLVRTDDAFKCTKPKHVFRLILYIYNEGIKPSR
jgi:hypothetical protein